MLGEDSAAGGRSKRSEVPRGGRFRRALRTASMVGRSAGSTAKQLLAISDSRSAWGLATPKSMSLTEGTIDQSDDLATTMMLVGLRSR